MCGSSIFSGDVIMWSCDHDLLLSLHLSHMFFIQIQQLVEFSKYSWSFLIITRGLSYSVWITLKENSLCLLKFINSIFTKVSFVWFIIMFIKIFYVVNRWAIFLWHSNTCDLEKHYKQYQQKCFSPWWFLQLVTNIFS